MLRKAASQKTGQAGAGWSPLPRARAVRTAHFGRTRMRGGAWLLALWALAAAGCSNGGNSLTGGGVPIGRAVVEGTVVDAMEPGDPVNGALVTLAVDLSAESRTAVYTAQTRTDAEGVFRFTSVPEGDATIHVVPPGGMHGRPHTASVRIRGADTASVAIAIEPEGAVPPVASLTVTPDVVDAVVGEPVTITAAARLADGRPVRPTWVVEGGIGRIYPNGRFMPLREGTGLIRVRAGDLERVIPVTVTRQRTAPWPRRFTLAWAG